MVIHKRRRGIQLPDKQGMDAEQIKATHVSKVTPTLKEKKQTPVRRGRSHEDFSLCSQAKAQEADSVWQLAVS